MKIALGSSRCSPQENTDTSEKVSLVVLTLKVTLWFVGSFLGGEWREIPVQHDCRDRPNTGNAQMRHVWRLRHPLSDASVGLICMSKVSRAFIEF